ncbi:DEAD/DEAH box helicase [Pontibacter fetidus]|uniref:DEAD/DEAH box helicase family protein n=1 Tax=Pontibacter fetidus TaxID=2700082 RepID=A0A6B2H2B6_9BACT|nr:DEAD/DEAH box helicase family protein [Pontibacter fetidus]NDK57419.1 DEAD/DEAH box helicase family protein [Pontibacter fetidus]
MVRIEDITLWSHQKEAIEKAKEYLDGANEKSFLLKLPTGAGKTGIFATLSRVVYSDSNILIVVPSIALRQQVYDEVREKFWGKTNVDPVNLEEKYIKQFAPADFDIIRTNIESNTSNSPFILICVINTLHLLRKKNPDHYRFLKDHVDFVIFDEGHREPAFSWASAVRGIKKKTLLFTATPFRNDLKLFKVDKESYYYLSHQEAINNNIIRDVEFFQFSLNGKFGDWIDDILRTVNQQIANFKSNGESLEPKTIIRCDNKESIKRIVNYLKKKRFKVLGIHEDLGNERNCLNEVPDNTVLANYDIIVHQFKLAEGIDYPNFLILVVFEDFNNERSLIQQIGRITRNNNTPAMKSVVICSDKQAYDQIWQKYLLYDNNIVEYNKLYDLSDFTLPNERISWIYFNGEFKRVSLKQQIGENDIILPRRVIAKDVQSTFDFEILKANVEEEIEKYDIIPINAFELANQGYAILYEMFNNSPYVKEDVFIENKLGIIIFYHINNNLFYFSTDNIIPGCINELPNLDQSVLLRVLSSSKRFTRINLINSDVGRNTIKSNNLTSYALEKSPIGLTDHNQVATLTEAIISDGTDISRRYVGLTRSRISDYKSDYIPINSYYNWLIQLNTALNTASIKSNYLRRFAQQINVPNDPTPSNIMFDVDADDLSVFRANDRYHFEIEECSIPVVNKKFKVIVSYNNNIKKEFPCSIEFDSKTKKYKIKSPNLSKLLTNPANKENFISYLNRYQPIRIVTKDNKAFYTSGNFYSPKLDLLGRSNDLNILEVFTSVQILKNIKSEKGNSTTLPTSNNLWHKDTLFGIVARMGKGYRSKELSNYFSFDILVCEDLNTEMADFIGIDTRKNRLVLIHAKADDKRLSASAFQEVCGQAVKNLDFLSPFYEKEPVLNVKRWDGKWKHSNVGTINSRILCGNKNGSQIWDLYQKMLKDPNTKKEVCLLTGALFCKNDLEIELQKTRIEDVKPEVIQLVYLIRSTWSAVSSVGATLKIFSY